MCRLAPLPPFRGYHPRAIDGRPSGLTLRMGVEQNGAADEIAGDDHLADAGGGIVGN